MHGLTSSVVDVVDNMCLDDQSALLFVAGIFLGVDHIVSYCTVLYSVGLKDIFIVGSIYFYKTDQDRKVLHWRSSKHSDNCCHST